MNSVTKCLLRTACITACVSTFAFGPTRDAQGCHGSGGGGRGCGGTGYGHNGGMGYGGMSSQSGQSQSSQPQVSTGVASVNDPANLLAHQDDLNLTQDQMQRLQKMVAFGKTKHATVILTQEQRKTLKGLSGTDPKLASQYQ